MNSIEESMMCIECNNIIESCYCSCPYCGEGNDGCICNTAKILKNDNKVTKGKHYSDSLKEMIKKQDSFSVYEDDSKRLEKWRFGRANFP